MRIVLPVVLIACGPRVDDTAAAFGPYPEPSALPEVVDPQDPLTHADGQPVAGPLDWHGARAPELRQLFAHYVYGVSPAPPPVAVSVVSERQGALDGAATATELSIGYGDAPPIALLVFTPPGAGPFPVFLGLNKCGNHAVSDDPGVSLPTAWNEPDCDSSEAGRASRADYWSIRDAIAAGFAVATFHQSDVDPDDRADVAHADGVQPHFPPPPDPSSGWATIAAWSWGLSRAVDALATLPTVDASRIVVFGHSRRGKAALWAGACDPRIAMVWAHQSGTAGAALSRSFEGESIGALTTLFPHWLLPRFAEFAGEELRLPLDQHLLLALIAPRPLLVTDGADDAWADPAGAEQAVGLAAPVWPFLDPSAAPPEWRLRPGDHEVLPEDWATALAFASSR